MIFRVSNSVCNPVRRIVALPNARKRSDWRGSSKGVCGHSCGCVVAVALASRLGASGLGLRGLVALDRWGRMLSDYHTSVLAEACLPVRPFSILTSLVAEPVDMPQVGRMLGTNHYTMTMPLSHAWDLVLMIRGGAGR